MAGRRWKEAIAASASTFLPASSSSAHNDQPPIVVLGGLANSYTHYIATEEEYGVSTLYGPHTLNAYINATTSLLPYLYSSPDALDPLDPGPEPPIHTNVSYNFNPSVRFDRAPPFKHFGQVLQDVTPTYRRGETVRVRFVGANPRNNLRLEGTFVAVEHLRHGTWLRVRDDSDWDLIYRWRRTSTVFGTSEVDVEWEIGETGVDRGLYRMRYFGDAKSIGGGVEAFEGVIGIFRVE
ncbi:MAG: hypothetical protein Q9221_007194 [Calogaya cf. arnoldii]